MAEKIYRKKEFNFKGKTLKEVQEMNTDDFAKLSGARARRSLKRNQMNKQLLKRIEAAKKQIQEKGRQLKPIRTHKRDQIVLPNMIGLLFAIHKGNSFETVEIQPEMLGHYFGELVLTRKRLIHGKAGIGATRSSTAITARG